MLLRVDVKRDSVGLATVKNIAGDRRTSKLIAAS